MLLITFEEKDAKALLDGLELGKFDYRPGSSTVQIAERLGIAKSDLEVILTEMHRTFHYRVTRWLQAQGARGLQ